MAEPWTDADSEAMLRASLMQQLEESRAEVERLRQDYEDAHADRLARTLERDRAIDEREYLKGEVERLRADLALLFAVYEAWMDADTYDPGEMPGIASLLGTQGAFAMEEATDAVDPHASRIREIVRATVRATGEDGTRDG